MLVGSADSEALREQGLGTGEPERSDEEGACRTEPQVQVSRFVWREKVYARRRLTKSASITRSSLMIGCHSRTDNSEVMQRAQPAECQRPPD